MVALIALQAFHCALQSLHSLLLCFDGSLQAAFVVPEAIQALPQVWALLLGQNTSVNLQNFENFSELLSKGLSTSAADRHSNQSRACASSDLYLSYSFRL